MNRDIELKKAILNWYCENADSLGTDDECRRVFKAYIYDDKGEYLIGGKSVLEFIRKARNLIYG